MKKYLYGLLGIIIGFCLSLTITTHADTIKSLIGLTVSATFPVKISGQSVTQDAILVDNKTYLPVRAMGDALGYDIGFDADLGVTLNKSEAKKLIDDANAIELGKIAKQQEDDANAAIEKKNADNEAAAKLKREQDATANKILQDKKDALQTQITALQVENSNLDSDIRNYQSKVDMNTSYNNDLGKETFYPNSDFATWYKQFTDALAKAQADKAALQPQLDALQSQLDALNNPSPTSTP